MIKSPLIKDILKLLLHGDEYDEVAFRWNYLRRQIMNIQA